MVADRLQLRPDRVGDVGGLNAIDNVGTHCHRHVTVDAPQDRLLMGVFDLGDLRQRNGNAVARIERQVANMGQIKSLGRDGARDNLDLLDAVAHRGDRHTREQHAQRLGDVLRRHSQRPNTILIDHEFQRWCLFIPVEMRIDHLVVGAHHLTDLIGDVPYLLGIRPDDTELHREADRGTEVEPVDAHARFRKRAIRDRFFNSRLDPLARLDILRHDDDLGE